MVSHAHARAFPPKSPKSVTTERNTKRKAKIASRPPTTRNFHPYATGHFRRSFFSGPLSSIHSLLVLTIPSIWSAFSYIRVCRAFSVFAPLTISPATPFLFFSRFFFYLSHLLPGAISISHGRHTRQGKLCYESAPTRQYPFPPSTAHPNLEHDIPLLRR